MLLLFSLAERESESGRSGIGSFV